MVKWKWQMGSKGERTPSKNANKNINTRQKLQLARAETELDKYLAVIQPFRFQDSKNQQMQKQK